MLKFTNLDVDNRRCPTETLLFDHKRIMVSDGILLEKITGRQLGILYNAFMDTRETEASVAFYWLAIRREHGEEVAGKLSDFDFNIQGFSVERVDDQLPAAADESGVPGEDPKSPATSPETADASPASQP